MRIIFIFEGGGYRAAYGAGFAKALSELGFRPCLVQGVSSGALNAASLVQEAGKYELMEKTWLDIESQGSRVLFSMAQLSRRVFVASSLFGSSRLKRLIDRLDSAQIQASNIALQIVVTNEKQVTREVINAQSLDHAKIKSFLLASCSISGVLPPVVIDGTTYSDGITFSARGIKKALSRRKFSPILIFILKNQPASQEENFGQMWYVRLFKGLSVLSHTLSRKEYNDLKAMCGTMPRAKIIVFSPQEDRSTLNTIHFGSGDISGAIEHGYQVVKEFFALPEHQKFLPKL